MWIELSPHFLLGWRVVPDHCIQSNKHLHDTHVQLRQRQISPSHISGNVSCEANIWSNYNCPKTIKYCELYTFISKPLNIALKTMRKTYIIFLMVCFQSVINFISCWTNIRLLSAPPLELAQKYFDMFVDERSPIWRDPCADPKHRFVLNFKAVNL